MNNGQQKLILGDDVMEFIVQFSCRETDNRRSQTKGNRSSVATRSLIETAQRCVVQGTICLGLFLKQVK